MLRYYLHKKENISTVLLPPQLSPLPVPRSVPGYTAGLPL